MVRHHWTVEQIHLLRQQYPDRRAQDIAEAIGVSVRSIYVKAKALGLKKSEAFFASPASGRTDGRRGASSRFVKGQTSWNAGKSFHAGGRSAETQFKSGHKPHTELPLGSYRVSGDGYCELKFSDVPGRSDKRWIPVHRKVWIEAHGPIPAGHAIAFRPGMKTANPDEITLDRLECISRKELAMRNRAWARGPEFGKLVQLKGAITRQVNRIVREHQEKQA